MSVEEESIAAVLRRVDAVNSMDLDSLDEHYTEDYAEHNAFGGMLPGLEGVKQTLTQFFAGMPDQHFEVDDIFAEGTKVVVRGTVTATHTGDFFGIPASNKRLSWSGIEIVDVRDGKVAERWLLADTMGMMKQMGVGQEGDESQERVSQ
jgi:steroid delta-isomerase-like uncharacterized protein